jgi:radical SAM superfamily enzyme YgiQ (UPF0313 family)
LDIAAYFRENGYELVGRGLWAHGHEIGSCDPASWDNAPLRVLVARLSTYRDVAQSTSHQVVAALARSAGAFVDFAYLPPPRDAETFREEGIPFLFGTTTKRPAVDFDIIAFSCSYILELLNLPLMLAHSGIPLTKSERLNKQDIPLIILGGASAFAAHIVDGPAGGEGALVDMRFLGDGEITVPAICRIAIEHRGDKRAMLDAMRTTIPGALEGGASAENPVQKALAADFNTAPPLIEPLVPFEEPAWCNLKLEIARGCAHGCSFCGEGCEYAPYRERSPSVLSAAVLQAKKNAAIESVDLAAFNFTDNRDLAGVIRAVLPHVKKISFKSGRLDAIARNPQIAKALSALGKHDATGGVEGISERLRRFCNKHLTEDEVVAAFRAFLDAGMREIKLFFIFTGRENNDDLAEYDALLDRLTKARSQHRGRLNVVCSFTPLTVMPNTPLQWISMKLLDIKKDDRILKLKRITKSHRFTFRLATTAEDYHLGQFLALADGQDLPAVIGCIIEANDPYYRKVPRRLYKAFRNTFTKDRPLGRILREKKDAGHIFPWNNASPGAEKEFLYKRYENAIAFENSEQCVLAEPESGKCLSCGACPSPPESKPVQPFNLGPSEIERLSGKEIETGSLRAAVRIDSAFRRIPKEYIGIAAAKALLESSDKAVEAYRGAGNALWRHLPISRNGDPAAGFYIYEFEFRKKFVDVGSNYENAPAKFKYGDIEGVCAPEMKLQTDRLHYRVELNGPDDAKRFENALRQVLEKKKVGFVIPEEKGVHRLVLKKKPLKSKFISASIDTVSNRADFIVKREFGFNDFVFVALGGAAHKALWSLEGVYFIPEFAEECGECGRLVEYDSFSEKPSGETCLTCSAFR